MRFRVIIAGALFAVPVLASAASGNVINGWELPVPPAPTTFAEYPVEQKLDMLEQRFGAGRELIPASKLVTPAKKIQAERDRLAHEAERREATMEECRSQLRKANRDGKFMVMLRCARVLLLQDINLLRRREEDLAARMDVSVGMRDAAVKTAAELTDALVTIVNAIDTGVYDGPEDLEDMKTRLFEQYRLPDLQSDVALRIDRHRQWAYLLTGDLRTLLQHSSLQWLETRDNVSRAASCIWAAADELDAAEILPASDVTAAAQHVAAYEQQIHFCTAQVLGIAQSLAAEKLPSKTAK